MPLDPRIEKLVQLWRENPKSGVWAQLANAYYQSGLIIEAIDTCLDGLKTNPGNVQGNTVLAKCYMKQGKYEEALICYENITKSDPQNLMAISQMAQIYYTRRNLEKSYELFNLVLFLNPYDEYAKARIHQLESEKGKDFFNKNKMEETDKEDITVLTREDNIEKFYDGPVELSEGDLFDSSHLEKSQYLLDKQAIIDMENNIEGSALEGAVDFRQANTTDTERIEKYQIHFKRGLNISDNIAKEIERSDLSSEYNEDTEEEKKNSISPSITKF